MWSSERGPGRVGDSPTDAGTMTDFLRLRVTTLYLGAAMVVVTLVLVVANNHRNLFNQASNPVRTGARPSPSSAIG